MNYTRQRNHRQNMLLIIALITIFVMTLVSCSVSTDPPPADNEKPFTVYTYHVINKYPHDIHAYTQGLVIDSGFLYEGTGIYGSSTLRKLQVETYDTLLIRAIPAPPTGSYFGEGICVLGNRIFQLTWLKQVGFIYDKQTFDSLGEFSYATQGWGLTFDSSHFIMSDGSAFLSFRDTATFTEVKKVEVHDSIGPVARLNELEYINGEVWANVYQTTRIVRIDPSTGRVVGILDLQALVTEAKQDYSLAEVLNGIAYDREQDRLFITGKNWPSIYEIEVVPDTL